MKRIGLVLLLCSAFFFTLCTGCSDVSTSIQKDTVLWVVTEASCSDGMNLQAKIVAERMEKEHPGLTVRLDILPTDPQEREITLKQLRTKIMAGNGPDVFLLPTGNTITTDYATANRHARGTTQTQLEPLFQDVVQAMRGGLFRDIQPFYLADATLDKQALKTEVMEAGVINGRRYVLPLRFDIPIVYTDRELWDSRGLNADLLDTGFQPLFNSLLGTSDNAAGLFLPDDMSLLPEPFDYENEQVAVSVNRITDYLRIYQAWKSISPAAAQRLADAWSQNWMDIIDKKMHSLFEVQPELREKIYLVTRILRISTILKTISALIQIGLWPDFPCIYAPLPVHWNPQQLRSWRRQSMGPCDRWRCIHFEPWTAIYPPLSPITVPLALGVKILSLPTRSCGNFSARNSNGTSIAPGAKKVFLYRACLRSVRYRSGGRWKTAGRYAQLALSPICGTRYSIR